MEQQVNEQPQMIYVQSSDGNKITLKPVTAQGGRQSKSFSITISLLQITNLKLYKFHIRTRSTFLSSISTERSSVLKEVLQNYISRTRVLLVNLA